MSESNGGGKSDIISLSKVGKSFWRGKERLDVLKELDLTMKEGSFEALMGPSGSGKSTLLNLIAGLDVPTSGSLKGAGRGIEPDVGRRSRGLPRGQHRLRVPDLQSVARADSRGERGIAAALGQIT